MTAFRQVWLTASDIDGWLTEEQAAALFDAARSCRVGGRIVEIGSFRGRSTIVLASGAPPSAEVIAIDPHAGNDRGPRQLDGFEADAATDAEVFRSNLVAAGLAGRVRHVSATSHDALDLVPGRADVLYIDGSHRYGPARADIRRWGERVAPGGTMLVHDSFSSVGVTLATLRELLWSRRFRYEGRVRSLAIYRFDPSASRRGSAVRQLAQLPWFAKNLLVKVLITTKVFRSAEWPY